jgi:hypothetical protein
MPGSHSAGRSRAQARPWFLAAWNDYATRPQSRSGCNNVARLSVIIAGPSRLPMSIPDLPADYPRFQVAGDFATWRATPLDGGVNAVCWPRALPGDFGEVLGQLGTTEEIEPLTAARLRDLRLSAAGREAVEVMLADLVRLEEEGSLPELNSIRAYPRDDDPIAPVDVYSYHVDSVPVAGETILCTYAGVPSEILRNDQARRRADDPAIRAELLRRYRGQDDPGFREYLAETCQDLHYLPLVGAEPIRLGLGHLWRLAVESPGSPVPPCIHRAPEERGIGRLLLIA